MTDERQQERIAAYVSGTMSHEQAAAFERELAADERLRHETDQWRLSLETTREWLDAEPPGLERVQSLTIPTVAESAPAEARTSPIRARIVWLRPAMIQGMAAAAIFVGGVLFGMQTGQGGERQPGAVIGPGAPSAIHTPPPTKDVPRSETPREEEAVESGTALAFLLGTKGTGNVPARYEQTADGRMVIETRLAKSGGSAVWVVDGQFQLARPQ